MILLIQVTNAFSVWNQEQFPNNNEDLLTKKKLSLVDECSLGMVYGSGKPVVMEARMVLDM